MPQQYPFLEDVQFTLPGSETPESVYPKVRRKTKAVEYTASGGRTIQVGMVTDFRVERNAAGTSILCATWHMAEALDLSDDVTISFPSTFVVTGLAVGDLTVSANGRTTLLPLFF